MSVGYILLEDGTRFDGELCADPEAVTGEVVFNTSMTGYQESVTDPSYAGQIIVFTYPLIGNYGVSAEAMESDRVHARGVVMRDAKNREDVASAEGGWLDWLGDCGVPGISGVDTRALVRHIRDSGAMRGGIFACRLAEAEARERIARRAIDGRRRPRPHGDPGRSRSASRATARTSSGSTPGSSSTSSASCASTAAASPCCPAPTRPSRCWPRSPTSSSSPTAPATPPPSTTSSTPSATWSGSGRCSGSASATSCSAARSACETFKLPFGHRGANHPVKDLATGRIDITSQNHGFAVQGPGGEPRIEADEPVRWETDFGAAELSHLNLYDRTVEGLVLKDVPGATVQYHPEAGPGPHDARHLFEEFLALAAPRRTTSRRSS